MPSSGFVSRAARGATGIAILACVVTATAPSVSEAQGQVTASWLDCPPNGSSNLVPACQFNIGEQRLVLTFTPGVDVGDVVGWVLVVDLVSDATPLVDWWQVQPTGCRSGQVVAVPPNGFESGCIDPWSLSGAAVVQSALYPRPGGDASQLRLIVGVGVPAGDAFPLTAGETYLAAVLSVRFARSVPPNECTGCAAPVCLVFNSAEIARLPGAPGPPPQPFDTPGPDLGNQVTWAGGNACSTVPARTRTWGQIKSLYR